MGNTLELNKIYNMDCLEGMKQLEDNSVNLIVTSPPYNMNDKRYYEEYEDNKDDYVGWLGSLFDEFKRILKHDGVICFNISYNNNSKDDYIKIVYNALQKGFLLQETISWYKQGMPLTEIRHLTRDFEFIFIFSKIEEYHTNQKKNKVISNVWKMKNSNVHIKGNKACFPLELPRKCIKLFSKEEDVVLDPFMGSGTTAVVCKQLNRKFIGFDINKSYLEITNKRLQQGNLNDFVEGE